MNNPPASDGRAQEAAESRYVWDVCWPERAACAGLATERFFAPPGSPRQQATLELCAQCRVRTECLAHALDERIGHGVYGGTDARWRRRLLQRCPQVASWRAVLGSARAVHEQRTAASAPQTRASPPRRSAALTAGAR
ncbi:WhiB family transcriptional regulator [Streptomyces sp. MNP-20]|uniref:WhiB family transcriptional regulator n=1 Tax=Streptomyces sp. MNP-20 TaxID=2721165 RepID=UPI001554BB4E|nr:WhiB family transcriptional regulator [Streptomyces sp. MNP-20]